MITDPKQAGKYIFGVVRLSDKGQIVIPKEVREMFGVAPGDTMVLLADRKKGVALQTVDKLNPMLRKTFRSIVNDEEGDGEEDEA